MLKEKTNTLSKKINHLEEELKLFGSCEKLPWNKFCPIPEGKTSEVGAALVEIQEFIREMPVTPEAPFETEDAYNEFVETLNELDRLIARFEHLKQGYHSFLLDSALATADDLLEKKVSEVLIR